MEQAKDFLAESQNTYQVLASMDDVDFERSTLFKSWTLNQIICHLHVWNHAALLQLTDEDALRVFFSEAKRASATGSFRNFEHEKSERLLGKSLLEAWIDKAVRMAEAFEAAPPKQRLIWAGPSMSARSSISARFMETWAHSQAIYDELGLERTVSDNIKNIVVLGQNTYEFCFRVRGLEPPKPKPKLRLNAPSGELWLFGDDGGNESIFGEAVEFCQVVTQCRNIADTCLSVNGVNARAWMDIAQCFAGSPHDPPAPGVRKKKTC